jgi:hypothetical protein
MLNQEYIDDSAKVFIAMAYVKTKYKPRYFMNPKYRELVEKIADIIGIDNPETLGNTIAVSVVCIEEFSLSEQTILDAVKDESLYSLLYEHIKDTNIVKELLNKAKVVHVTVDPTTGDYKEATVH